MRMSLQWKVTLALVAFGLIPAGIVAYFAIISTDDFISKQNRLISTASAAISDHAAPLIQKKTALAPKVEKTPNDKPAATVWEIANEDRHVIHRDVTEIIRLYSLPTATVFVVDPEDHVLYRRRSDGSFDEAVKDLPFKYQEAAKLANGLVGPASIDARYDPTYEPPEIVGYSPVRKGIPPGLSGHGLVTLVSVPRAIAYETIYKNQSWTLAILVASGVLTLALGFLFGRWFIRPLLEIKDVTEDLHEGHL